MPKSAPTARLLYAASEASADALYFARCHVPDAFFALELEGRKLALISRLESARVRRDSAFDEVLELEDYREKAKEANNVEEPSQVQILKVLADEHGIKGFEVPRDFSAGLLLDLQEAGFEVGCPKGPFFPQRECKTAEELDMIREGNAASTAGLKVAEQTLRKCEIQNGELWLEGRPMTSERLRLLIDMACMVAGATASHTICAGGDQACDPHEGGHGVLRANVLIIVDVFPRINDTGYFGDMTRTFLRGEASPEQRRLVETVLEGQRLAIDAIHAGTDGQKVHQAVTDFFESRGYHTEKVEDQWHGFFHGTGHGLGLEVHEAPRLSIRSAELKAGHVVTVEPGLYYPGLGGCRIEDVVAVTDEGCEKLSDFHYDWELD